MTEIEARKVTVGESLYVADLLVRVNAIYESRSVTFFQTDYGDFAASVCERCFDEGGL